MICEDLLLSLGAEYKSYDDGERIFSENETPAYHYFITKGKVKLNNYIENGKEFIHAIINEHCSVAESHLFSDKKYSINAVAIAKVEILRTQKKLFIEFLHSNPEYYSEILQCNAQFIHNQMVMMRTMAIQNPESKIKIFLDLFKDNQNSNNKNESLQIPFTRQQLASSTGLSVETVIRAIKNMEKNGVLQIQNRKIFY